MAFDHPFQIYGTTPDPRRWLSANVLARAVFRAITEADRPWPGHGILWADVRGDDATILDRPPRGVAVGR